MNDEIKIKVGDVVKTKSGKYNTDEPYMTVATLSEELAMCEYWNDEELKYEQKTFVIQQLQAVDE